MGKPNRRSLPSACVPPQVPKSVAGQLQSSNLEFHDIMWVLPLPPAAAPQAVLPESPRGRSISLLSTLQPECTPRLAGPVDEPPVNSPPPPAGACRREYNPAHIASPPYKIFVRTESPFLKDKLDIQLTLTIEEVEPGVSCRQVRAGPRRGSGARHAAGRTGGIGQRCSPPPGRC